MDNIIELTLQEIEEWIKNKKHFIIEVTPELSEIIQNICFKYGLSWLFVKEGAEGKVRYINRPYLFIEKHITHYTSVPSPHIGLPIVKLKEVKTLTTQEDCWKALSEGKQLRNKYSSNIYGLVGGRLELIIRNSNAPHVETISFHSSYGWEIYEEPKEWYENIPEQGILCWVTTSYGDTRVNPVLIIKYVPEHEFGFKFRTIGGDHLPIAIPLTLEEIDKYIYKGELDGR